MHAVWCSDVVEDAGTQLAERLGQIRPGENVGVVWGSSVDFSTNAAFWWVSVLSLSLICIKI